MDATTGSRVDSVSQLEHELVVLIRRVRRGTDERAKMLHPDLPAASYSMLAALADGGARRSSELADMFSIDKGAVSRHVRQLEDLGLVERSPDSDDGRAFQIAVTEVGRCRLADVAEQRRSRYDDRLATWQQAEIIELTRSLARYNALFD